MFVKAFEKDRRRVNIQGALCDSGTPKILRYHFALLGYAKSAVNSVRGMRDNGAVKGRVPPTAYCSALAVEEGELDIVLLCDFNHLLHC